jgi:LuxR family quorum sensing-dependent transcriptional regulator
LAASIHTLPSLVTPPPDPHAPPAKDRVTQALAMISRITRAKSVGDAVEALRESVEPFGVSTYTASILANPERVDPRAGMVSNMPDEWTEIYMAKRRFLYDPVVQEAARQPGNFFWRDISESTSALGNELFEDARQYGLIDGFSVSSRSPWPIATIVSLAGKELIWNDMEQGVVALVASSFMSRVLYLRDVALIPTVKALSPQERRILHLAASGQSDREIVNELGIHRSTLLTHWVRLRTKLDANDRAHAVAVGLWSGQIAP